MFDNTMSGFYDIIEVYKIIIDWCMPKKSGTKL